MVGNALQVSGTVLNRCVLSRKCYRGDIGCVNVKSTAKASKTVKNRVYVVKNAICGSGTVQNRGLLVGKHFGGDIGCVNVKIDG